MKTARGNAGPKLLNDFLSHVIDIHGIFAGKIRNLADDLFFAAFGVGASDSDFAF